MYLKIIYRAIDPVNKRTVTSLVRESNGPSLGKEAGKVGRGNVTSSGTWPE